VPVTLLQLEASQYAAVVEAGTNHPGELAPLMEMIAPHMGVITNIGREHLEYFKDLEGVAREEGTIAEALPATGALFINGDSPWAEQLASRAKARVIRVGVGAENQFRAENIRFSENGVQFTVVSASAEINGAYQLRLLGRHQVVNALFAIALGAELGLSHKQIECGLAECAAPKMRLQYWNLDGIGLLEDCYNANTDSMLASLETLHEMRCRGRRVAVLGDMGEQGDASLEAHLEVGRHVPGSGVDQLFTVGKWASHIAAAAREAGLTAVQSFSDADSAGPAVRDFVRQGDVVLVKASRSMRLERISEILKNGSPAVKKGGC
jgi:UDP-N-acetylmuramoyl-tripeptide--D-alanyl-D-alanine ligase